MKHKEIAYQNKDITSKVLAENFKGKSFRVYGLDIPEIRRAASTNIPVVKANELRLDNLFELADGTAAVVDYESVYDKADKVKYLNYITGIAGRYLKEKADCPMLRMVVIYTGDISRKQVSCEYDIGAVRLSVEPAFLSEMDGEGIYRRLKEKVEKGQRLTDEELMEFIILPLSYRKKAEKEQKIRETVELAVRIRDRSQQIFTLAGILVFTDKVIDRKTANKIRRAIEMTQVAMIFEEEKQQELAQAAEKYEEEKRQMAKRYEEEKRQALTQAAKRYEEETRRAVDSESKKMAARMIKMGYSTEEIISVMPDYSWNDIEKIRKETAGNIK